MDESKLKRIFTMHQEIRLSEFDVICRALGVSSASVLSEIEGDIKKESPTKLELVGLYGVFISFD